MGAEQAYARPASYGNELINARLVERGAREADIAGQQVYRATIGGRDCSAGKVMVASGYERWTGGTGPNGEFIAPHDRTSGTFDLPRPDYSIKISDAAELVRLLDLQPTGTSGRFTRSGFPGSYILQQETDGSLSVFFTGGTHRSSGVYCPPQTFHHGAWDKERRGRGRQYSPPTQSNDAPVPSLPPLPGGGARQRPPAPALPPTVPPPETAPGEITSPVTAPPDPRPPETAPPSAAAPVDTAPDVSPPLTVPPAPPVPPETAPSVNPPVTAPPVFNPPFTAPSETATPETAAPRDEVGTEFVRISQTPQTGALLGGAPIAADSAVEPKQEGTEPEAQREEARRAQTQILEQLRRLEQETWNQKVQEIRTGLAGVESSFDQLQTGWGGSTSEPGAGTEQQREEQLAASRQQLEELKEALEELQRSLAEQKQQAEESREEAQQRETEEQQEQRQRTEKELQEQLEKLNQLLERSTQLQFISESPPVLPEPEPEPEPEPAPESEPESAPEPELRLSEEPPRPHEGTLEFTILEPAAEASADVQPASLAVPPAEAAKPAVEGAVEPPAEAPRDAEPRPKAEPGPEPEPAPSPPATDPAEVERRQREQQAAAEQERARAAEEERQRAEAEAQAQARRVQEAQRRELERQQQDALERQKRLESLQGVVEQIENNRWYSNPLKFFPGSGANEQMEMRRGQIEQLKDQLNLPREWDWQEIRSELPALFKHNNSILNRLDRMLQAMQQQ